MMNELLARLRKQHKKTQQELADSIGITRSTYTQYETGRRAPDYVTIKKIAAFFSISVDYLLRESTIEHMDLVELFNNPDIKLHINGVPLNELNRLQLRDMIVIFSKAVSGNNEK